MLQLVHDELYIDQVSFKSLAEEYGTPLYVYHQPTMQNAVLAYKNAFAALNPLLCFAVKANGNLSILRYFASLGCGFDIVSGGELARVLQAGGQANQVIFSGVGKSEKEIRFALESGIRCFNVESIAELHRLNDIAGSLKCKAPVSLRINPDVDAKTHPYISTGLKSNKFGIAYDDALEAYRLANSLPNLDIQGMDCHIGSQLTDVAPLIEACERMVCLYDQLVAENINPHHLDLGGGVGICYQESDHQPDLSLYADAVKEIIGNRPLSLILEPGRSLIAKAGVLLTQVEYIKQGEEKNFIIIDAAMNDLMRPTLYQAYHHIQAATHQTNHEIVADVVGPICETGDWLGKARTLAVQSGDLLVIHDVGAYGASMASNYNARCRAAEVMVSGSLKTLIRRRETMEDLWRCEVEVE